MSEVKKMTLGDVAARDGRGGNPVWLVYRDSVYDVTHYVKEHPGGDLILEEAGRDATTAFNDVGHSGDAKSIMAKFKIGELVDEEKKYDASGKKKKIVTQTTEKMKIVAQTPEKEGDKSCLSRVFCGLL